MDSEMNNGRQRVFNFAMGILDSHTLGHKIDIAFEKLRCAAQSKVVLDFVLKNVEDEILWYY